MNTHVRMHINVRRVQIRLNVQAAYKCMQMYCSVENNASTVYG